MVDRGAGATPSKRYTCRVRVMLRSAWCNCVLKGRRYICSVLCCQRVLLLLLCVLGRVYLL